jgi:hypothetical protein
MESLMSRLAKLPAFRLAAALVLVAGIAGAVAWGPDPTAASGAPASGRSAAATASVAGFDGFPLYAVGDVFEDLPLSAVVKRDDPPTPGERVRASYVAFIYGDCVAQGEAGCPPPIEIQVWPACERTIADYSLTPAGDPLPHEATFVRGVPAAFFEDHLRLELYTANVTIVVFGLDAAQVRRAASALRAVNALAGRGRMLPPPVAGALEGRLSCA